MSGWNWPWTVHAGPSAALRNEDGQVALGSVTRGLGTLAAWGSGGAGGPLLEIFATEAVCPLLHSQGQCLNIRVSVCTTFMT